VTSTVARTALLEVSGLNVSAGDVPLVRDVSFDIGAGERVGLIGESGSGKTLTALALLGLLPEGVEATGRASMGGLESINLIAAPERTLTRIRGDRATMVFQEPMTALNPLQRVGDQVAEVLLLHGREASRAAARRGAVRMLEQVELPAAADLATAYPHQLSGGQRQRVMLAVALANDPRLLICDEPTTALDVTVQAQILDLVVRRSEERGTSVLFVTHDLAVVAQVCHRVVVLYGGRVVETGGVREVFTAPRHPYTEGLLAASDLTATDARGRLRTIRGTVPDAGRFPGGCVFRDRCAYATDECTADPPRLADDGRTFACWHPRGRPRA
jgi:oligopeptide/dipeptide ABC transporter ATP-binding protein